jgi:hypothetical protein
MIDVDHYRLSLDDLSLILTSMGKDAQSVSSWIGQEMQGGSQLAAIKGKGASSVRAIEACQDEPAERRGLVSTPRRPSKRKRSRPEQATPTKNDQIGPCRSWCSCCATMW